MNRILVGLDTSDAADLVLQRALELSRSGGGKVRLLRVVGEHEEPQAVEADLRALETRVPEALRDGVVVELGTPWEGICRAAQGCRADMVVIGAHRHSVFERVLGTTAAKVVNHIDRPVLVVRTKALRDEPSKGNEPGRDDEHDGLPKKSEYALLEATALAGAASGAAVGAVAGPPGMILGGTIGTAIGVLAGTVLDEAKRSSEAHERELDEAIGVTQGDLGAREEAKAGLEAMQRRAHAQRPGKADDD